jgi:ABC-2 type transport system ATP-binding protein
MTPAPPVVVHVEAASFAYGDVTALDAVSLDLHRGEFVALLGNNGAGKSTLFSLVAGIRSPGAGTVEVDREGTTVGYAPQDLGIYPSLSVRENLELFAGLNGVPRSEVPAAIGRVAEPLFLGALMDRRGRDLSGGEKRRLHTALALVHGPDVALLDEPTVGVDPETRSSIVDALRRVAESGVTVLYSTHYFGEVEPLAPRVVILDHGRVVADSPLEALMTDVAAATVLLSFHDDHEPTEVPGYACTIVDGRLQVTTGSPEQTLGELLDLAPWPPGTLRGAEIRRGSLEDAFRQVVGARR